MFSKTNAAALGNLASSAISIDRIFSNPTYRRWLLWLINKPVQTKAIDEIVYVITQNVKQKNLPAMLGKDQVAGLSQDALALLQIFERMTFLKQAIYQNKLPVYIFQNRTFKDEETLKKFISLTESYYDHILQTDITLHMLKVEDQRYTAHFPSLEFTILNAKLMEKIIEIPLRTLIEMPDSSLERLDKLIKINFKDIDETLPSICIPPREIFRLYLLAYKKLLYYLAAFTHSRISYLNDLKYTLKSNRVFQNVRKSLEDILLEDEGGDEERRINNALTIFEKLLRDPQTAAYSLSTVFNSELKERYKDDLDFKIALAIMNNYFIRTAKPEYRVPNMLRLLEKLDKAITRSDLLERVATMIGNQEVHFDELLQKFEKDYCQGPNPIIIKIQASGQAWYIHRIKYVALLARELTSAKLEITNGLQSTWLSKIDQFKYLREMSEDGVFQDRIDAMVKEKFPLLYIAKSDKVLLLTKDLIQNLHYEGWLVSMFSRFKDNKEFSVIFGLDRERFLKEVKSEVNFVVRVFYAILVWFRKKDRNRYNERPQAVVKVSSVAQDNQEEQARREKEKRMIDKWRLQNYSLTDNKDPLLNVFQRKEDEVQVIRFTLAVIRQYLEKNISSTEPVNQEQIYDKAIGLVEKSQWGAMIAEAKRKEVARYVKGLIKFYFEQIVK